MKQKNAIGYVRISGRDQSKYSLDGQEHSIRHYCKENGLELIAIFKDNGAYSFSFERPEWLALERFVEKHKGKAQYLIIVYHDRFSRNVSHPFPMIDKLQRKYHIKVLFRDEAIDIDPEEPVVFMQRVTKFAQAHYELLLIRERTKQALREAMEEGRVVNNAAFGYKNAKDILGKSHILVDEERAPIVQFIYKSYLDGDPISKIYEQAKKMGLPLRGHGVIRRILGNCVYAGLIKVPATIKIPLKYIKGIHQPLISEEDFFLVQKMQGNKSVYQSQPKESMPLRGILECSCGSHMTAGWSRGKSKRYLYYRCIKHSGINIPGQKLHETFEQIMNMLSLREKQKEHIEQKAREILNEKLQDSDKLLQIREQQMKSQEGKMEKLEDKMINDEIDKAFYSKWHKIYVAEGNHLLEDAKGIRKDKEYALQRMGREMPHLISPAALYREGNHLQRQQLVHTIFKYGISYSKNSFRTPHVNIGLQHNLERIKDSGLLVIEPPAQVWEQNYLCF